MIGLKYLTIPFFLVILVLLNTSQAQSKKYCLLVGIEDYSHDSLKGLKYCIEDALDLAVLLKKHGFEGKLLTDNSGKKNPELIPTKVNIERNLEELTKLCKKDDMLLLAFAGHGLQFTGSKDAYFCPNDARPFPDQTETLVSVTKIYDQLERSFAGVKIILFDACRNDPDPGRGRGIDANTAPVPPRGIAALFSCSLGQRAYEHDELKHGIFFHHVLKGIEGAAANKKGEVTFNSLFEYIGDAVPQSMKTLFPMRQDIIQTPTQQAEIAGSSPIIAKINTINLTEPVIAVEKKAVPKSETVRRLPNDDAVRFALTKATSVEFIETPLSDAIQELQAKIKVPIEIDQSGLDDAGIVSDELVTCTVKNSTLKVVFSTMLQPLNLTYRIENGAFIITSIDKARNILVVRTYRVRDLIPFSVGPDGTAYADAESLNQLITDNVEPDSWEEVGGIGKLSYTKNIDLVVSQSEDIHEKLTAFFKLLRSRSKK